MNANFVNSEYLESKKYAVAEDDESLTIQGSKTSGYIDSWRILNKLLKIVLMQIDENGTYFRLWHYLSSVHLAPISSIIYSFVVVIFDWEDFPILVYYMRIFTCLIDSIFMIKIYIGLHLSYKDPESGLAVTKYSMICKRYFKSLRRFWLDAFTLFPFETVTRIVSTNKNIYKIGFTNRILRSIYLKMYYDERQEYLNLRTHLRWTYLIYWIIHTVQWITCAW